jgi:HYDIN/CFA65/VesB family protein
MSRPVIHRFWPFLAAVSLSAALVVLGMPAVAHAAGQLTLSPAELDFPATTVEYPGGQQQVQVQNTGDQSVWIGNVFIDGGEGADFSQNNNCGGELKTEAVCQVNVSFWPHGEGIRSATLHVSSDADNPDATAPLAGTGAAPQLSFEPGAYDFGLQQVNSGSVQTNFVLRNTGAGAVQLNNLDIVSAGPNAFWTGNSDCWGRTLQPNDTCNVQVNFGPNQTIEYSAQLRAQVNGLPFTADLSGKGGQAVFSAQPDPAAFGSAGVGGQGVTRDITITNTGDLPGGFFVAIVSGGDVGSFRVLHEDCTGALINPSASCTAEVRFQPDDAGAKAATLTFVGGQGEPFQMRLTGEGVDPRVSLTPASHDFGRLQVGDTGQAQPFELRNDGDVPLRVGGASIVGDDTDQFRLAGDECTDVTLAAGASCQVRVRFAPEARGARSARLRLLADGGSVAASLTGTGLAKDKALVSFHWRDTLRPNRGGIVAGYAACNSDTSCKVHARATLRAGAAARHGSVRLPSVRLRLGAGEARSLRLRLPGGARTAGAGGERLKLLLDWSSGGHRGHFRGGRRLG